MEYNWKITSLGKKIDPNIAVQELERIKDVYGKLTPDVVVAEAEKQECVLHAFFMWDDTKAAHQYRLQQARNLINNVEVKVITDGDKTYQVAAYEITTPKNGYKNIESFNKDDISYIKMTVKSDLSALQRKLKFYNGFSKVSDHIEQALIEVENVE